MVRAQCAVVGGGLLIVMRLALCVWFAAYTKLNVWNLVEYDKVVYIDADAMVVDNIDEVPRVCCAPAWQRARHPGDDDMVVVCAVVRARRFIRGGARSIPSRQI
jgi:hypothetical protein